jgi:CRP/FNR family cyclic AMP-dependent transcriptional regulator
VRETIANGFISRAEVQRLESLRNQLQIKKTDHERVMATLADEDRAVLADPTMQASAEKRLQLETYSRALAHHLERVLSADRADDTFILQLRQEFGVTQAEHVAVLDRLLGDNLGTTAQVTDALRVAERAGQSLLVLDAQSSPSLDLLADLLRRARSRAVDRLLRTLNMMSGDAPDGQLAEWLTSNDEAQHLAAIEALRAQVPQKLGDELQAAHAAATSSAAIVSALPDLLLAYTTDTDPYVRTLALYARSERNPLDDSILLADSTDEHELVRATAEGLRSRMDAGDGATRDGVPMLTVEKMIALRCVPLFASLEPAALEDLAESSTDSQYAPGQALCIEGEPGDEVFVLMAGDAAVVAGTEPDGEVLRVEREGSVIGEMAVLEATLRSASVFAGGAGARVLRLNGAAFHAILDTDPAVADGVIRTLARRIRTREVADTNPIG